MPYCRFPLLFESTSSIMRSPVLILALIASLVLAEECSPLHLIYARATTEPPTSVDAKVGTDGYWKAFEVAANKTATKGYGAAGWAFVAELTKKIPGTTTYAVHYPVCSTFHIISQYVRDIMELTA